MRSTKNLQRAKTVIPEQSVRLSGGSGPSDGFRECCSLFRAANTLARMECGKRQQKEQRIMITTCPPGPRPPNDTAEPPVHHEAGCCRVFHRAVQFLSNPPQAVAELPVNLIRDPWFLLTGRTARVNIIQPRQSLGTWKVDSGNVGLHVGDYTTPGGAGNAVDLNGTRAGSMFQTLTLRVAVDGAFKTPTLRNVELTGPYMHHGGMKSLEVVVQFYARGSDFAITETFRPLPASLDWLPVPLPSAAAADLTECHHKVSTDLHLPSLRVANPM